MKEKTNAFHKWFLSNKDKLNRNSTQYEISLSQLVKFYNDANQALSTAGETDRDDLEKTVAMLAPIVKKMIIPKNTIMSVILSKLNYNNK